MARAAPPPFPVLCVSAHLYVHFNVIPMDFRGTSSKTPTDPAGRPRVRRVRAARALPSFAEWDPSSPRADPYKAPQVR